MKHIICRSIAAIAMVISVIAPSPATATPRILSVKQDMEFVQVASGLEYPVSVVPFPDGTGRLAVLEQLGHIRVIENGQLLSKKFHTVPDVVEAVDLKVTGDEAGLLGLAFHPDFATNRKFYIYYTDKKQTIHLAELLVDAGDPYKSDPSSEKTILTIKHPKYANHFGGQLLFGADGYLYVGVADGGGFGDPLEASKKLSDLRGKILRIDVNAPSGTLNYSIPADNPFVNRAGARKEIYAYGLRNPWRFSIDPVTGYFLVGDVGQWHAEELDLILPGKNYGWNIMEADTCFNKKDPKSPLRHCKKSGLTLPVYSYVHPAPLTYDDNAIIGGGIYRGSAILSLVGKYFFADFTHGYVKTITPPADPNGKWKAKSLFKNLPFLVSAFGTDTAGEVLACGYDAGVIYKLVPKV